MSNIAIRQESSNQPLAPRRYSSREWDPFRAMRNLIHWGPFAEMAPSFSALDNAEFVPDFEIKETRDAFLFRADVPGVKDADLDIKLTQNRLSVSGKRESEKTEKGDTFYATERSYGSFTRAFTLPDGVDAEHIKADLKDGVLTLSLPKKPEVRSKKIDVTSK
jgi:HSP20 family protein